MHLSTLASAGLASILFNALLSHGQQVQLLRGGKLPIPELPSTKKLVGTNWQLKEIRGDAAVPEPQTLFFEMDTELTGYDGCNGFTALWDTVPSDENGSSQNGARPRISIDIISTSYMFCELAPEADRQKNIFMGALRQEAVEFSLSVDEQELTLYGPLDNHHLIVPIVLTRIPNPPQPHERLIGTSWVATDIVYPDSSELLPVLEDHPVTLTFSQDEIEGSTGTNHFFGTVSEMTSTEFQVSNVGQTLVGWEDDTDPRMFQEHAWMGIIGTTSDGITTLPYTLFEERIGDTDEFIKVLVLGSSWHTYLARFVPLQDGMMDEWGKPIKSPLAHDGKVEHCFNWHDSYACRAPTDRSYSLCRAVCSADDWYKKCIMCKKDEKADRETGECTRSGGDDDDDTPASPLSPLAHDGKVEHCFSWHYSEACRRGGPGHCPCVVGTPPWHDWYERCIMCKMDEKADKLTGECVRSGGDDDDDTPASPLVGTEWQVTEFNGAPALLFQELSFETETDASGNDGCNPFNGTWGTLPTNDGNDIDTRIMIDVFSTGGRMCSFTAEAAGQRTFLHNVLFQEATPYFLSADEQELILYLELKQEGSRPLPMVLSRIKNSIPDNEDTPIALGGGKSLIGMNGEEAKAAIEAIDPLLSVHIVPEGSMVTMDLRDERVRIFVDKDENVAREPQIG